MRCFGCGGEMRLTNVVPADAMEVRGFEQHTLTCRECGDVEQRLVFGQRAGRSEAPIEPPAAAPIAIPAQASPATVVEAPIQATVEVPVAALAEAPIKMSLTSPVESAPLAPAGSASQAAPAVARATWAQATERLQLREAKAHAKTQEITQEIAAEPVATAQPPSPAKLARELDDFDRLWESLAQPLPPPAPPPAPLASAPPTDKPVAVSNVVAFPKLEHDPEKWMPGFGKRSCSTTKVERDDDSRKSHLALTAAIAKPPASPVEPAPPVSAAREEAPAWRQHPAQPTAASAPASERPGRSRCSARHGRAPHRSGAASTRHRSPTTPTRCCKSMPAD